jgi:hypothetical protein
VKGLLGFDLLFIWFRRDNHKCKVHGESTMKKLKLAGSVLMVFVLASASAAWVFAGDLEPAADPAPTMHSLEDIYTLVENINALVDPAPCGPCDVTGAGVAKTGQTSSYATGDDGDLQKGIAWPDPRFSNNGDGTVTDNQTGLIWLRNANRGGSMTWADALTYCNNLADDGLDLTDGSSAGDWRLPNTKEIFSLVDFGNPNFALPVVHPFSNVQSDHYWSSTTKASETGRAWSMSMASGHTYSDFTKGNSYYVWPVRGGN